MKLIIVLSRFPYPLEKGDKLRAYHQIKELSTKHELYLICLTDVKIEQRWRDELNKYCKQINIFRLNPILIYWNTAKQLFTDKPFQIGYFYQFNIQKKINSILNEIVPDHIYCQLVRSAEYVKNFHHYKKTIDYMDALGKGMQRRAEISKGIWKKLYQIESRRLGEYENRIFDYFDAHTIISEQDKKFINHSDQNKIVVIENGIAESFFSHENKIKATFDIVFTGNMNYAPNVECAEFLVNKILPKLIPIYPKIKILLSGANPGTRVKFLASDNVTISGWVEDIRDSYSKGKIFVAPLFIGTGLQNKLLEAMAMGLPCITTTLANNALQATENENILIANNTNEFVEKICQILDNKLDITSMVEKSRDFVHENFSWRKSTQKLSSVFEP